MSDAKKYDPERARKEIAKIYPSEMWHDSVQIVGGRLAIEALRDACNDALENGTGSTGHVLFESDGEGYEVFIMCEDYTMEDWHRLPLHYADKDKELCGTSNDKQLWNNLIDLIIKRRQEHG